METPHFCEDKNYINLSEWLHIIRGKWEYVFTIQIYLGGEYFMWCIYNTNTFLGKGLE